VIQSARGSPLPLLQLRSAGSGRRAAPTAPHLRSQSPGHPKPPGHCAADKSTRSAQRCKGAAAASEAWKMGVASGRTSQASARHATVPQRLMTSRRFTAVNGAVIANVRTIQARNGPTRASRSSAIDGSMAGCKPSRSEDPPASRAAAFPLSANNSLPRLPRTAYTGDHRIYLNAHLIYHCCGCRHFAFHGPPCTSIATAGEGD